ncbi:PE family protein [Mycobacterium helveticum]|uniref:PE family protein n=1 Tax=Mycobacterium helveticum TaxID=2592811 RepID=A0A557XYE3_9MYCO|nr:PE family protein [Mycobacterium helveticum]TVS87454.1 PE family protein [Mycobacterium helveticum]TVS91192.1 PE family protein [Mycobacterium helveticum]
MSFVTARPEMLTAAAGSLSRIGSAMASNNAAAEGPTTGVAPPAADQVSQLVGTHFAAHGLAYQTIALMANQIHEAFVNALSTGATSYTITEAANVAAAG